MSGLSCTSAHGVVETSVIRRGLSQFTVIRPCSVVVASRVNDQGLCRDCETSPRLVLRVRLVAPAPVVEIRIVVGDLGAVQPVDRHPGPGDAGVVAGIDRGRRPHDPELRAVGSDVRVPSRRAVLHEGVVDADVGRAGVARRRRDEDQPELVAVREAGGRERPGRGDPVFLSRRPAGQGQEGGDRHHQAGRGPEERRAKARERPACPAPVAAARSGGRPPGTGGEDSGGAPRGAALSPDTARPAPRAPGPGHADAAGAAAAERSVSLRRGFAREGGDGLGGEPRRGQNSRLSALGSRLSALGSRLSALGSRLSALGSRLSALGSRLSALGSRLSALGSRLSALGSRLSALGSRLSALGSRLSALGSRLSALGSRLSALGSRLSALGSRLSALGSHSFSIRRNAVRVNRNTGTSA